MESGETDAAALQRELMENLGIHAEIGALSMHVSHEYDQYTLDLLVYRASTTEEPQAIGVHTVRWVPPGDFDQYTFPGADQQTVDQLLA